MREITQVVLIDGGTPKTFKIQQMSAWKAQKWIAKFILLLGGENVSIADLQNGEWGKILASIADKPFDKVEDLVGELLACCSAVRDDNVHIPLTPQNVDSQIDSVECLLNLEKEAFVFNSFFGGKGMSGLKESQSPEMPTVTIPK